MRTARSQDDFFDALVLDLPVEELAVDRFTSAHQKTRHRLLVRRFDLLLRRPSGRRIRCDVEAYDEAPIMPEHIAL